MDVVLKCIFSQLTTPLLDKLMKVFKLTIAPGNRPTKEFDMAKALVEYALPEALPEEVAASLVARRRMFQEDAYAMLAHLGNLEKLEGAVDDDDYELPSLQHQQLLRQVQAAPARHSHGRSGLSQSRTTGL